MKKHSLVGHFVLLGLVLATPGFALKGLFGTVNVGQVHFNGGGGFTDPAIGYGVSVGSRMNKTVDFVFSFLNSVHGGQVGLQRTATGISAEFHPIQLDSLECTLGVGTGINFFSNSGGSSNRFDLNLGGGSDLILGKSIRLGLAARVYFLTPGSLGGNTQTILAKVGYYFDL